MRRAFSLVHAVRSCAAGDPDPPSGKGVATKQVMSAMTRSSFDQYGRKYVPVLFLMSRGFAAALPPPRPAVRSGTQEDAAGAQHAL